MLTASSLTKATEFGNSVVTIKSAEMYGQFFNDARDSDLIDDNKQSQRPISVIDESVPLISTFI